MIFSILKKDLKRKKTMNLILLLFIIVASLFVASSVNNIITVMNGTDYYFDEAELGDYVVLTMGNDAYGALDQVLLEDCIKDYRLDDVIFASKDKFSHGEDKLDLDAVAMLEDLTNAQFHFFDENNEIVEDVEKGKVYVTGNMLKKNDLQVGDKIRIQAGNVDKTFEIAGRVKDALFGSAFMGNIRFLMNEEDYKEFEADNLLKDYYRGQIACLDVTSIKDAEVALSGIDKIAFAGDRSTIKMCYMMDMVIAGILVVISICLIIISFVVLKFTISFSLTEEFREIGVMKAIGIRNWKIRSIYVTKYLAIAIVGAILGLFASFPVSDLLLKSVSENMVLGNKEGVLINVISSAAVILIVCLFAYLCTRKVKKFSPIDAIRSGQSGERFRKKSMYQLTKSKLSNSGYMAVNDILSSPKRFVTIVVAFFLCSLMVLVVVNTTVTMQSKSLVGSLAKESDVYVTDNGKMMQAMTGKGHAAVEAVLSEYEELFASHGMDARCSVEIQYKYPVEFEGEIYQLSFQQGVLTNVDEYEYYEGTVPQNAQEIAVTESVAKKLDAHIGDEISVTINGETKEYLITAYFQSMNQLGEVIRLHEDVPTNLEDACSAMAFQFDFLDDPDQKEIDDRVKELREILNNDEIFNAAGFTSYCIGVVGTMLAVEYLLAVITIIVVMLVTILMERSFTSQEKGEVAILKAIGFSNKTIIAWHMKRFAIVALIAEILAVALSIPMTHLCITPIFAQMGMHKMHYEFDFVQCVLLFPGIILAATLLSAFLTSFSLRKIESRDTASIE